MRMSTLCILLIALVLPLACSRAQETAEDAAAVAGEAADAVAATAQDAADAAAETASDAKQAASDVATGLTDDPIAKCSELAAKGAWSEALDVCTKAHQADPDNMAVEHALQQAQAAAEQ